jgi:hypothetical protein
MSKKFEAMQKLNELAHEMLDVKNRLNMYEKNRVFSLPMETVDDITKANLIECKNSLKEDMEKWEENPDAYYIHPDDVVMNSKIIRAMGVVIDYFGGE